MKAVMQVKLAHAPNPDVRGGYWQPPIDKGKEKWVDVQSLEEAAATCRAWIERNDLGGGNWTGGEVRQDGNAIGYISYNGRVWSSKPS